MREALKRSQRKAVHLFEPEQHLNHRVRVGVRPAAFGQPRLSRFQYALLDPHRHVASRDQARVVLRPVPDTVFPLGLTRLVFVLAHLLGKNRESTQFDAKLTGAPPPTVARKRQAAAPRPDICNNAVAIRSSISDMLRPEEEA